MTKTRKNTETEIVTLNLPHNLFEKVVKEAQKRDVSYKSFIKVWLYDLVFGSTKSQSESEEFLISFDSDTITALEKIASERGMGTPVLITMWILERLKSETNVQSK